MKKHRLSTLIILMTLSSGCSDLAQDIGISDPVPLQLTVSTSDGTDSKALIMDNFLSSGSQIGVYIRDSSGESYDGFDYNNIRYTASGSGWQQYWNGDRDIMLSGTKADLYAYYPYSANVTSASSIPVQASSTVQTDYMYATPEKNLNNHNPSASVLMNHALAAIRISVSKGSYSGIGRVTSISVKGNGIATSGYLDGTDGSLSSLKGENSLIEPPITPFNLTSQGESRDILVIPNGKSSPIEVAVIIDGERFNVSTSTTTLEQGKITAYDIIVNNGQITVSEIQVKGWNIKQAGSYAMQKNLTVSLSGNTEGMNIRSSVDGDVVTITATPVLPEDTEVNPVSITGDATYKQEVDSDTGVLTITLTDIRSDLSIAFDGISLWITSTFDITDTSTPVSVFYHLNGFNILPARMKVNGADVPVSKTLTFADTGINEVKMAFKDYTVIHQYSFMGTDVMTAKIPEGVEEISQKIFSGCKKLKEVSLPESLNYIGYECFYNSSLERIVLPKSVRISDRLFSNCRNLTEVVLPEDLKEIPMGTFYECGSITEIHFPETLEVIGRDAFSWSNLETLDLPASLKTIKEQAFQRNYNIKTVISRAAEAPALERNAFIGCNSDIRLFIPAGSEESYRNIWYNAEGFITTWELNIIL